MTLVKYLSIPAIIIAVGAIYWFISRYEAAGTVMIIFFGIAMALLGWILVPTFGDVGPTAPVDSEWHERK